MERDPRVYFAAEPTFLAWIRTGLALMGVGFAVARFGLFLRGLNFKLVLPGTFFVMVSSSLAAFVPQFCNWFLYL